MRIFKKEPYLDYFIILISFLPLVLVIITISILVLLTMGRPILFRQKRVGYKNKAFKIYKFRSMRVTNKKKYITKLGSFLRKTSLDEIPSIINVLKREMSIVGPRPLPVAYLKLYSKKQIQRHNVLPGITGLAQINGRNILPWKKRFRLDVQYIKEYSVMFDFKIITKTFFYVLFQKNIYYKKDQMMKKFRG
jgi:lipopolysaccharide/colanic/teichoic acid biosynthesis glycosyltransferase